MKITLSDEQARAVEAVAALEHTTTDEIVGAALTAALADRLARLRELVDALQPALAAVTAAVAPAGGPAVDDTCDDCGQRHGPDDPECAAQDAAPTPPPPRKKRRPSSKKTTRGRSDPAGTRCKAGDGSCRAKYMARGMCSTHYERWRKGEIALPDEDTQEGGGHGEPARGGHDTPREAGPDAGEDTRQDAQPEVAGDGVPSPAPAAGDALRCQAHDCSHRKVARDAKFCASHTTRVSVIAEKMPRRDGKKDFAGAVQALIDGQAA